MDNDAILTRKMLIHEMWRRGDLSYMLRPHAQTYLYDKLCNSDEILHVFNCHRRLGKTHYLIMMALERALQVPESIVRFAAPQQKQCEKIVKPIMAKILKDCPGSLYPRLNSRDNTYTFSNGSSIALYGLDRGQGDKMRGEACDIALLDEVREVINLQYVVDDVLAPQFVGRDNPKLIMATTPPRTLDHDFVQIYISRAMERGTYYAIPYFKNKDWRKEDEDMLVNGIGIKKDSNSWKRELECQLIAEEESLICPEFLDTRETMVKETKVPEHYFPIVSVDFGWKDFTAALFGYFDFEKAAVVIQDEIIMNNATTKDLYNAIRKKEIELWKKAKEIRRFADCTPQQKHDFERIYNYCLESIDKEQYFVEEAINSMRADMARQRIIISPKCKHLIFQLENGIWKTNQSGKRVDFERTKKGGHWDAGMALTYMLRMIKVCGIHIANPSPKNIFMQKEKFDEIITGDYTDLEDIYPDD